MQELLDHCWFLRLLTIKFYAKSHQYSHGWVNHTASICHSRRHASKRLVPLIRIVFVSDDVFFGFRFHLGPVLRAISSQRPALYLFDMTPLITPESSITFSCC